MRALLLVPYYVQWHYSRALKGVVDISAHFIWFLWHFFSIGLLVQTLFSPWQRIQEERKRGLDIEAFFSTLLINLVMRCVGIVIRLTFIIIGLAAVVIAFAASLVVFAVWVALPLVILVMCVLGIILLFGIS